MTTEHDRVPLSTEVSRLESEDGPHAHHPPMHFRVLEQLKQRNVFRVAVLYLMVCWLILDPVHVVFHMLDVPVWANRLVVMLMAVGFPAVVIFAWVYEITPEGLKPTIEVPHVQSIRKLTGRRLDRAIIAVLGVALAYFVVDKFWISRHRLAPAPATAASAARPAAAAAFAPPAHSIAVLPFVNMSGDASQEYFSDGLTEELLNSLARINELQVAARTSSFTFKGKDAKIGTIARELNVGAVLEGSVRRSASTVRITAQLVNAVTGFHLWSETYDRDLGDVLKLQTEIANAVATALRVTLLGDIAPRIELGGTRNALALDAYLRASRDHHYSHNGAELQAAITVYGEAIRADPHYALALAGRSRALAEYGGEYADGAAIGESFSAAQADARLALQLAPELAEGHEALAKIFATGTIDFSHALAEYERAVALAPGNAQLLAEYGRFATFMGRAEAGVAAARRAVVLDPLNTPNLSGFGQTLLYAHRYEEAAAAFDEVITLAPGTSIGHAFRGIADYLLGNFKSAVAQCELRPEHWVSQRCLAITYDKLGRRADAEAVLAKFQAAAGDSSSYQYATIYAQWGDTAKALQWLEAAMRVHDAGMAYVKADPLIDPLRAERRFRAIERALKFPP